MLWLAAFLAARYVAQFRIANAHPLVAIKEVATIFRRLATALALLGLLGFFRIDAREPIAACPRIAAFIQLAADASLARASAANLAVAAWWVIAAFGLASSIDATLAAGAAHPVAALRRAVGAWLAIRLGGVRAGLVFATRPRLAG